MPEETTTQATEQGQSAQASGPASTPSTHAQDGKAAQDRLDAEAFAKVMGEEAPAPQGERETGENEKSEKDGDGGDDKSPASKAAIEREAKKRRVAEVQARVALDRAAGLIGWDKTDLEGLPVETIIKLGTKAKAALDAKQREHDQRTTRPGERTTEESEGGRSPVDPGKDGSSPQADPEASARVAPAEGLDAALDELDDDSAEFVRAEVKKAKTQAAAQAEQARQAFVAARAELVETWGEGIRGELQAEYPALSDDATVSRVMATLVENFGSMDVHTVTRDEFAKKFRYAAFVELGESTRKDATRRQVMSARQTLANQPYTGAGKRGSDRVTMTSDDVDAAVFEALNSAPDLETGRRRVSEALGSRGS